MSKPSLALDRRCLRRALELARQGRGLTLPNPRVGAILAIDGRIIGEGFHQRAGEAHAEVHAFADAQKRGEDVTQATLYVTLEPCSTHGRTPPCTDLILKHKIRRVVFAATDPNPLHAGAAAKILRHAGIEVSYGLCAKEAMAVNEDFNFWMVKKRPWVVGKIALSLDGKITTPPQDNRWLTSPEALQAAHELRWESDAILIGAETARQDNPRLTVRLPNRPPKTQPLRVVVTRSGNLPASLHLFTDKHRDRTRIYQNQSLQEVLLDLGKQNISHVLLEGGGKLLTEALQENLVNEVAFFLAPALTGTQPRALELLRKEVRLTKVTYQKIGPDFLARGRMMLPISG